MPGNMFSRLFTDKKQKPWIDVYGVEMVALLDALESAGEKDAADCFLSYWMEAAQKNRYQRRLGLNKLLTILAPMAQDGKWHVFLSDQKGITRDFTRDGMTFLSSGDNEIRTDHLNARELESMIEKHIRHKRSGRFFERDYRAYFCESEKQLALAVSFEECRFGHVVSSGRTFTEPDWYFFLTVVNASSEPSQCHVLSLNELRLAFGQFLDELKL